MPTNFRDLITNSFLPIINSLTVLLAAVALFVFFKGLAAFIGKAGDAKGRQDGKNLMIWGVVALFVLVSIFGILRFFYADFGFESVRPFGLPLFNPI